jgi:tetratricopeptide (TPR) repeat protein
VLRGHLHTPEVEAIVSTDGSVLEVAAGASYQGSRWPCRTFLGSLDLAEGLVTLRPIRFVDRPKAVKWVNDMEVFPGDSDGDGTARFQIPNWAVPGSHVLRAPANGRFPHADWTVVNHYDWLPKIVEWFSSEYRRRPEQTFRFLFDHVFEILDNVPGQSSVDSLIMDLGSALRPILEEAVPIKFPHHLALIELLAFGLNRNLSHLFMLPRVDREALLVVPNYSRLLLATRKLAAGEYRAALTLVRQIGDGCCVALYVSGQCDRKMELNHEAASKFEMLDRLIDRIDRRGPTGYSCTASLHFQCRCDPNLMRASLNRARGVVARRIGDDEKAIEHFDSAILSASHVLNGMASAPQIGATGNWIYEESPHRVLADIFYSYGYFWYERRRFDQARELFIKSIDAIASSDIDSDWDSPHTRLAILELISGNLQESVTAALSARNICLRTSPSRNREALLSLAIISLTLRVLEVKSGRRLIDPSISVMDELETALYREPKLGAGPLACHRRDVEYIAEVAQGSTIAVLVIQVVGELERACASVSSSVL